MTGETQLAFILGPIVSYFIGSIPFAYIVARVFGGLDIRQHGSGNVGATNVAR
ncbi:MAG TPA: acyl-phosphate--glycerol-3-phosphate O-acyltransferase, partial [Planctomycetia bacterium]|nr:acyl-phosphate--glycerol-3-phosphate O-acyltransferase [Planctomycetia bacterium]